MLTKRIIPCLDIKDGQTVKGIQFRQIKNIGDPVALAAFYAAEGADELVFLDISATAERRKTLAALITRIAKEINIPFTVGGGIRSVDDISILLHSGADKISLNAAAFLQPELIAWAASRFGSQCIVLAVDSKKEKGDWYVYLNGGKVATGVKTETWIKQATANGAGEVLLTAINNDGMQRGFASEHIRHIASLTDIPVIASGGAGNESHFAAVLEDGGADAALAASIFHTKKLTIPCLKRYLSDRNIAVRL